MSLSDAVRLLFLIVWLASCGYAWWFGSRPERLGAATMFFGALASFPAAILLGSRWTHPELGVLLVDILVLGCLVALLACYDRNWLIWATASQLIAVMMHIVTMVDQGFLPRAYSLAQPFWAYPALIALSAGTAAARSRRNRIQTTKIQATPSFWAGFWSR